jgi:deazaflavin-dependent oxidoreductase (nitroreductase family)
MSVFSAPPGRLLRPLFKLPLWLYQAHLGWVMGHRFARLTHRGRRSGRVYRTVVEVVRYDQQSREVIVGAGWGGQTDWFRNIQATPALEVRTSHLLYRPVQRFLTDDEMYAEVRRYLRSHRLLARYLFPRLLGIPTDASEAERRAIIVGTLRGVAFRPQPAADGAGAGDLAAVRLDHRLIDTQPQPQGAHDRTRR